MNIEDLLRLQEKDCDRKAELARRAVREASARKPLVWRDVIIAEVNSMWADLELASIRLRLHEVMLAKQEEN